MSDVSGDTKPILEAIAKIDKPCGTKDVAEATGIDN